MNDRERLVELVFNAWLDTAIENGCVPTAAQITDHFIANGVTIQKHGRWKTKDYDSAYCSCCKKTYIGFFASEWLYCPNCGAKMDLEVSDG